MKPTDEIEANKRVSLKTLTATVRSTSHNSLRARRWWAIAAVFLVLPMSPGLTLGSHRKVIPESGVVLDNSFGNGGLLLSNVGTNAFASQVAIQSDGKLVAAGYTGAIVQGVLTVSGSAVARYNTDGSRDTTFGTNGVTTITTSGFAASGLVIQKDGKIVLVGATNIILTGAFLGHFALARLNTDGSMDTTFGTGGLVLDTNPNSFVGLSVAIQSDGEIVAVGGSFGPSPQNLAVVRYNPDGSIDSTFGTGGEVTRNFMFASSVRLQSDGKIVVGGNAFASPAIMRLNPDGSPDDTFGTGGVVQVNNPASGGSMYDLTVQADGKIVMVGSSAASSASPEDRLLIIRCNTDGSRDAAFGSGGIVISDLDGLNDAATSVAIQSDGEIVVSATGFSNRAASVRGGLLPQSSAALTFGFVLSHQGGDFGLVRYNSDGSLDTTFGAGGKLITTFSQESAAAGLSVAIQPDGKILAAGAATVAGLTQFALVRYQAAPVQTGVDFSLSAVQQSQTLEAGSSTSFVIDAQPVVGMSPPANAVALTASVIPAGAGVTTQFSNVLIGVGSSSTLTVTAAANTPPGLYSITVDGTAGTLTHSITLTATVQTPSFTLGFSQQSVAGVRGTKVSIVVLINRTNGFDGTVTVSAPSILPDGIKPRSSNQVATTGSSATFSFKVKQRAAVGSDPLTFTGTDSSGHTQSATVTLVVQ